MLTAGGHQCILYLLVHKSKDNKHIEEIKEIKKDVIETFKEKDTTIEVKDVELTKEEVKEIIKDVEEIKVEDKKEDKTTTTSTTTSTTTTSTTTSTTSKKTTTTTKKKTTTTTKKKTTYRFLCPPASGQNCRTLLKKRDQIWQITRAFYIHCCLSFLDLSSARYALHRYVAVAFDHNLKSCLLKYIDG